MNYFEIEYHALLALEETKEMSVEALAYELQRNCGYLHAAENLAAVLAALEAGGYVTVKREGGMLSPFSTVALTEMGMGPIRVGGMAKLFAGMKKRAMQKNGLAFCSLERPVAEPYAIDTVAFAEYSEKASASINDAALWRIQGTEDGFYSLTLQRFPTYETDDDAPEMSDVSILADRDTLRRLLHDFVDTALDFLESHKTRKILLSTVGQAYVMTFCEIADETGDTVLRVTAAPILYNRQRFIGKRDSDLDYAQCGNNVLSFTMDNVYALCASVFYTVIDRIDLFDEEIGAKVNELYQKIS